MSLLRLALPSLQGAETTLETFDRNGHRTTCLTGDEFVRAVTAFRSAFTGWPSDGRKVVGLLFKSEETVEFLVTALAAIQEGFTIVPLYPNWSSETQLSYFRAYRLRAIAHAEGFQGRVDGWIQGGLEARRVLFSWESPFLRDGAAARPRLDFDLPGDHPCAWIFTSGTSGKLAKLTEISIENLECAIRNIQVLDFLRPGMALHCPLSASHIFAFVCVLGFLTLRPRRVIFSDVQFLSRLPESRTGRIDGMLLVPMVIHRLRAAFYEKLVSEIDPRAVPPGLETLARIPLRARRVLKRIVLRAESALIGLETNARISPRGWAAIQLARKVFGRMIRRKIGSPSFVVVGGAKPCLQAMAFFEVMGIRCLQGWGMTETTGPLAVCSLRDRYSGAFGTCGNLFGQTRAYIEDGELVVVGPQIARGYHEADGTFLPFHGRKRTGDEAEFDRRGRLRVVGKASDRITTENGLNYNPVSIEEEIHAIDLERRHLIEQAIVIGDGRPRLGAVFFLREGVLDGSETRRYLTSLLERINSGRPIDERIVVWTVSGTIFKDAGLLGPSGKVVRRRAEESFASIFPEAVELVH